MPGSSVSTIITRLEIKQAYLILDIHKFIFLKKIGELALLPSLNTKQVFKTIGLIFLII